MSDSAQEKMAHAMQDQQAQWSAFTTKALESSMKLFELNLKMAKQSLEDVSHSARHLLAVKSPEQIFAIDQELMQERLNQVMSYANEIGAITSAFTTELSEATQSQLSNTYQSATKLTEQVKHQPSTPKFFPQLGELNHGYDQWMDAGKKLVEAFGQGMPVIPAKPVPIKKPAAKPAASRSRAK